MHYLKSAIITAACVSSSALGMKSTSADINLLNEFAKVRILQRTSPADVEIIGFKDTAHTPASKAALYEAFFIALQAVKVVQPDPEGTDIKVTLDSRNFTHLTSALESLHRQQAILIKEEVIWGLAVQRANIFNELRQSVSNPKFDALKQELDAVTGKLDKIDPRWHEIAQALEKKRIEWEKELLPRISKKPLIQHSETEQDLRFYGNLF